MTRAMSVCSRSGCPNLVEGSGRCAQCKAEAERKRGSASQRGYGTRHRTRFRAGVLRRDKTCKDPSGCNEPATEADHYPVSRRDLVAKGLDPDDPIHGRGLCKSHHAKATGLAQPGGWNIR